MPMTQLNVTEEDVVRLTLEFLANRQLNISQLSLERETGVINGNYSDDLLYLRQLILDGQWDDVLQYTQPLTDLPTFQADKFKFIILRHRYIELLCIRSEIKAHNEVEDIVEEVVKLLDQLEKLAPSKEEYAKLRLLLPLPSITEHAQYKQWNPSTARVQCFREVYPLVEQFLVDDKKNCSKRSSKNDRLMQLLIRGLLYESCVHYCQSKATGSKETEVEDINFSSLLAGASFDDNDLSLLSWLQSIPIETFSIPFEHRMLNVSIEKLERPSLHTSWTEHMLITPIKPKTFPHNAMPFRRPRSAADAMSRSLRPLPDGAPRPPALMAQSAIDYGLSASCYAGFHLTGIKGRGLMNTSVDKLFEEKMNRDLSTIYELTRENFSSSLDPSHRTQDSSTISERLPSSITEEGSNSSTNAAATPNTNYTNNIPQLQRKEDEPAGSSHPPVVNNICNAANTLRHEANFIPRANPTESEAADMSFERNYRWRNLNVKPPADLPAAEDVKRQPAPSDTYSTVYSMDSTIREPAREIENESPNKNGADDTKPRFQQVTALEDTQAVRCAEFHPDGNLYAVGSNTKTLRICVYPKLDDFKGYTEPPAPTVLLKRTKHHKGSIYCMAWSPAGDLLATGSNDKTVKVMHFNPENCNLDGQELELSMHDGTVRDVCFIEDTFNRTSLLVSGGAGDCKIYVTDCTTGQTYKALSGHTGHVLTLCNWGGAMFVSGSLDKSIRFWDLRTGQCENIVTPHTLSASAGFKKLKGGAVTAVSVEPSGRLLVSGHEHGVCMLHDIRGNRVLQEFTPHSDDVRSVRFSPGAYYLLSGGYDGNVVLTDLQGDLTKPVPSVVVARHRDKVISARWHPKDYAFLSTSADKTAVLWTLPSS